jgi:hypothetical protein
MDEEAATNLLLCNEQIEMTKHDIEIDRVRQELKRDLQNLEKQSS